MSDYYVVKAAACSFNPTPCTRSVAPYCRGCLGDGSRAVLDTAIEVERYQLPPGHYPGSIFWRAPAPTREDNDQ